MTNQNKINQIERWRGEATYCSCSFILAPGAEIIHAPDDFSTATE